MSTSPGDGARRRRSTRGRATTWAAPGAAAPATSEDLTELPLHHEPEVEEPEGGHERRHDDAERGAVPHAAVHEGLEIDLRRHHVGVGPRPGPRGEPDVGEVVEGPEGGHQ